MIRWLEALRDLQAAGRDCVRVTVMDVRGSAPREVGACMLVTDEELIGSVGGGQLEYECTRLAAAQLAGQASAGPYVRCFPLGASMGQCCGGVVDVLFEHLPARGSAWLDEARRLFSARTPAVMMSRSGAGGEFSRSLLTQAAMPRLEDAVDDAVRRMFDRSAGATCLVHGEERTLLEPLMSDTFAVALFGAGHVGSAVVNVLASLDCRIRWIDSRRDIFPSSVPGSVTVIGSADPAREVLALPAGAFYLVMTHSHPLDYEICEQVLARDDFSYCGLIGSRSKRRRFEKRMRRQGMPDARLARLTCPIGVRGIDGKRPGEIAIAVAAELLQVRERLSARNHEAGAGNVHPLRR